MSLLIGIYYFFGFDPLDYATPGILKYFMENIIQHCYELIFIIFIFMSIRSLGDWLFVNQLIYRDQVCWLKHLAVRFMELMPLL